MGIKMTKQLVDYDNMDRKIYKVTCDSCNVLVINNHICHEYGCPDAWRDEIRECKWCGNKFHPENNNQQFCDDSCYADYSGIPMDEDSEGDDFLSEEQLYPD